jgi:hypothetical protein
MFALKPFQLSAYATSLCAALLLWLALSSGGSQGLFQLVWPIEDYSAKLLARADLLRVDIGLDLVFISAYLTFFTLWSRKIAEQGADRLLVGLALSLVMMTGLLDAIENAHILAMLRCVEMGGALSQGEILLQQVASQVKFQMAYAGMAGLGLLWQTSLRWQWLKVLFLVQMLAGLALHVTTGDMLKPLYLFRASFFVVGPLLVLASLSPINKAKIEA